MPRGKNKLRVKNFVVRLQWMIAPRHSDKQNDSNTSSYDP